MMYFLEEINVLYNFEFRGMNLEVTRFMPFYFRKIINYIKDVQASLFRGGFFLLLIVYSVCKVYILNQSLNIVHVMCFFNITK